MEDAQHRIINYLRLSVTDRCNLRCRYCMPDGIEQKRHEDILSYEDILFFVEHARRCGIDKVRVTGGEPLARKNILFLLTKLGTLGLRELTMTTNATLLTPVAHALKEAGLARVNVSLDTLRPQTYQALTGGTLSHALAGIHAAKEAGLGVKLHAVLMNGINHEDLTSLAALAEEGLADEVRFIELMALGQTSAWAKDHFLPNQVVRDTLQLTPLEQQVAGQPATLYTTPKGGRIGLISPVTHQFCSSCNRVRLTSEGKLKLCLLHDNVVDLRPAIRDRSETLYQDIARAVMAKPVGHHDNTPVGNMNCIGG